MNGGEFGDLERELRAALDAEARRIEPNERHAQILAAARARTARRWLGESRSVRRWLVPLATAASVALLGGAVYNVIGEPPDRLPAPALSTSATTTPPTTGAPTTPSPTGSPSSGPNRTTTSHSSATSPGRATTASGSGAVPVVPPAVTAPPRSTTPSSELTSTAARALPAYFVGPDGGEDARFGLFRQFVRGQVPEGATPAQLGEAALSVAMSRPAVASADYLQPWTGVQVTGVEVGSNRIDVSLSHPGSASGLSAEQSRLAVQQLVWTVQAGVGQGSTPVRFTIDDGSTSLFGRYPTSRTYDRPGADTAYQDLAPLWIDDPAPGTTVNGSSPVVATGQSCTFEAVAQWQLRSGGSLVDSGSTTATSACPTRGTWQIGLGDLPKGTYTLRVFTTSAGDGKTVTAQVSSRFTVG